MNRKEAIAEYKNRKPPRGAYSLRFADGGPVFVDALLFALRIRAHRNKELQAEWDAHGGRDLLKDKRKEWVARLQAHAVTP
jgi:hypothetical protein